MSDMKTMVLVDAALDDQLWLDVQEGRSHVIDSKGASVAKVDFGRDRKLIIWYGRYHYRLEIDGTEISTTDSSDQLRVIRYDEDAYPKGSLAEDESLRKHIIELELKNHYLEKEIEQLRKIK